MHKEKDNSDNMSHEDYHQQSREFVAKKRDQIAYYLQEPATVLRQRYLILAEYNHCAALLLDIFKASSDWKMEDVVIFTLRHLQEALFSLFSLAEIGSALRFLLEREYVLLAPEPNITQFHIYEKDNTLQVITINRSQYFAYKKQVIDERQTDGYTFLVDRPRIRLLSEAYEALHAPGLREISLKQLRNKYKTEEARVAHHNLRATAELLPATLNLIQWICTLDYFQWQCAYCRGSYHLIEHYIPIVHDGDPTRPGGTTWSNCVPACRSCNGKKGTQHPSLVQNMPALVHIERYLSAIRTVEAMMQRQSEEQGSNDEQETLASLDPVVRQIITSYRRDRERSHSLLTLSGRRRTGVFAAVAFLLLLLLWLLAPHTNGWNWQFTLVWIGALVVCLCGGVQALLTYFPKKRQAIEEMAESNMRQDKERIQHLICIAQGKQE